MTAEFNAPSLSQARQARGLTLEDAERSTHISRRFLVALEEHDYTVFPAPIYARGFLRTYCRYLGVDPEIWLEELPEGWSSAAPATQLQPVSRGALTFNPAWLFAGVFLVALAGLGIYLSQGSSDLGTLEAESSGAGAGQQQPTAIAGAASVSTPAGQVSTEENTPVPDVATRPLDPGIPGVLPDFTDVAVEDVTGFLEAQSIAYLRIDTESPEKPLGLVIAQSPEAGTETADLNQVTLTVSAGASADEAVRTDCGELEADNRRTTEEQAYFEDNCTNPPPAPEPTSLPDRTNCEEIRGTDYRSASERAFFLQNCIVQ